MTFFMRTILWPSIVNAMFICCCLDCEKAVPINNASDTNETITIVDDWSKAKIYPWTDEQGSTITCDIDNDTILKDTTLQITFITKEKGWAGLSVVLDMDLSHAASIRIMAKSIPEGTVVIGLRDSSDIQYETTITVPNKWSEVTIPINSLKPTPFPDPNVPHSTLNLSQIRYLQIQSRITGTTVFHMGTVSYTESDTPIVIANATIPVSTIYTAADSVRVENARLVAIASPLIHLKVQDNHIVDKNGTVVVLKGLCLGDPLFLKQSDQWSENHFRRAASWGANIVSIIVSVWGYHYDKDFVLKAVDSSVAWSKKYHMYVNIDWHGRGNMVQGIFSSEPNSTTMTETVEFWSYIAKKFKNEPTVAFYEIFSEPAAMESKGGSMSWAQWRDSADVIIDSIFSHNPGAIPLVAGLNEGYDLRGFAQDPLRNKGIAFSVHPFPGRCDQPWEENWEHDFGYLSKNYPIIFTEFGFNPNDSIRPSSFKADSSYGKLVLAYADERGISWMAFVFFNYVTWPMPLISDWSYKPTESGAFFKNRLTNM